MNYLDLFSGIGGFAKGIEDAGIKIEKHFFSEIDKNAISIYQKHFPKAIGVGDVSTIRDVSKFGKIDLISFGFPCQDLSIAGKGRGLEGSRSGLFYEAVRLVKELKPKHFIFENVKGLLTNNGGQDFERCLREVADIGLYDCEWQLVNTSWLLPQNRERIYFIGHLRGESRPKVFPFTKGDFKDIRIQGPAINTIPTRSGENNTVGSYVVESKLYEETKRNSQGARVNNINGNSVCLSAQGGGQGAKTGLYVVPHGNNQVDLTHPTSRLHGIDIRRLTPLECERLQGFPDGWTLGYSDSARYKALGNAVSVPIVKMIIERLFKEDNDENIRN